ncbi:bacillithiol system protein YtxJ [Geomicrobium halophilum]|uniref:Bacillithiol system protein YtxJ n=1 Tax=Geomicrobium halophilum TaxID=549000 RepID=A0A841PVC6_9BACL|nr:bacillithiol system redox-active protein YtxJ [Geomicrobium halophilum]MBB6448123.1 bacillithiol system protein YtxJ [Geomicrobium halophilum]
MQHVYEQKELMDAIEEHGEILLFKNSTTCPISANAFDELKAFATEHPEVPVYYLNVQDERPLSEYVATFWDVKHESPQALLLTSSEAKWHTSHSKITEQVLEKALV